MKYRITIKLDSDLLREVRILAAKEGLSVSSLLASRLEDIVHERKAYDRAKKRALARLHIGFNLQWIPSRSRGNLHER